MALELSERTWKVLFASPAGRRRERSVAARDVAALLEEIAAAKRRLGLSAQARVVSCYEAGRDGFWLDRALRANGIDNLVVDSSSIEVARQVDLGTYAGPSFILGHDKGGLVGIAVIEHVGRTTRIMARKDLGLTKVEQLKGLKVANQTGSSVGNIFVDQIAPAAGLKKGDYQEVRMDVNNMVAAMAAKTVDAMVNVEPYNAIAEADGLATTLMDYWSVDKMPVFMAATPEFVAKSADTVVAYLKAWLDVARDFKESPDKVADAIYGFYASKGYTMSQDTFRKALATVDVNPGFPSDLGAYMAKHAEVLLKEKKIAAIPDWSKALRPDFMERARSGT